MVLGVYWYYGFPDGLYHFDYFTFCPGRGGHADGPAELTATVQVPAPDALLTQLQALAATYPHALLFGDRAGDALRLTLGDYQLYDYHFHVAGEVETLLRQAGAVLSPPILGAAEHIRFSPAPTTPDYSAPSRRVLSMVSAGPYQHHAESLLLRLDCHLPLRRKAAFLQQLDALRAQAGLDVLYYLDHDLPEQTNLMVFFGNGRQGVGGQRLRRTDAAALETTVEQALTAHGGQPRHLGRFPQHYPSRGPHLVRMVDADFIVSTLTRRP